MGMERIYSEEAMDAMQHERDSWRKQSGSHWDEIKKLQVELDKYRWIPVSEPPEKAQLILAKHKGGNFFVLQHNPKYHTDGLKKDYTHYREIILPKGE